LSQKAFSDIGVYHICAEGRGGGKATAMLGAPKFISRDCTKTKTPTNGVMVLPPREVSNNRQNILAVYSL